MGKTKQSITSKLKHANRSGYYAALLICATYFVLASVWIIFSDKLLLATTGSYARVLELQSVKGIAFVAITTFILYLLIARLVNQQRNLFGQLRNTEGLCHDIFTASPEAQLIYNTHDLTVIEANQQACHLLNIDPQAISESRIDKLFANADNRQQIHNWCASQTDSAPQKQTFEISLNGGSCQLSVTQHHIQRDDRHIGFLVIRDISEIRRYIRNVEHAAKRLDIAREVSDLGCWEMDLGQQQVYCCNNVSALLGLDTEPNTAIPLKQFEQMINSHIFCEIAEELTWNRQQQEVRQTHTFTDSQQTPRHVLIHAHLQKTAEGESIIGTILDQTEYHQIEAKLRQQQMQWNNLVETLPEGVGVIQDRKLIYANQAVISMLNAGSLEELTRRPLLDWLHPDHREDVEQRIEALQQRQPANEGFVHRRMYRLDGKSIEVEVAARLINYQGRDAVQVLIRDLTETVKAREALASANRRLASLSSKTLDMLERDRKRIAGELHDDVGQSLTAIKLMTRWLTLRLKEKPLLAKAEDIQQICGNTLETVRNLSLMLRPAQLDSLGLPAAIEWQAEKLFGDTTLVFQLDASKFAELRDKNTEIIAFRVIQESLTNIARHAKANTVEVRLDTGPNAFNFTVIDDGIGFDVSKQRNSTGLVNMQERVELANGEIKIGSLPNIGTEIIVSLPMQQSHLSIQESSNDPE